MVACHVSRGQCSVSWSVCTLMWYSVCHVSHGQCVMSVVVSVVCRGECTVLWSLCHVMSW